jgi:hypothetical protein
MQKARAATLSTSSAGPNSTSRSRTVWLAGQPQPPSPAVAVAGVVAERVANHYPAVVADAFPGRAGPGGRDRRPGGGTLGPGDSRGSQRARHLRRKVAADPFRSLRWTAWRCCCTQAAPGPGRRLADTPALDAGEDGPGCRDGPANPLAIGRQLGLRVGAAPWAAGAAAGRPMPGVPACASRSAGSGWPPARRRRWPTRDRRGRWRWR